MSMFSSRKSSNLINAVHERLFMENLFVFPENVQNIRNFQVIPNKNTSTVTYGSTFYLAESTCINLTRNIF